MKSNRVPFTDVCELITQPVTKDADGYDTFSTPTRKQVFCSIIGGVSRSEMYEALKVGVRLSATAEIWEDDLGGAEYLEHNEKKYKIVRTYPTGGGTLELSLEEVIR